jgi:ABC-2 type transport system ATP-binding protein
VEIVSLRGVSKEFGKRLILNNINLSVEENDIFGIIGVSGSGKSTLLNLMVGFTEPDEGRIQFHTPLGKTHPIHRHSLSIKQHFGYNPQGLSFYPKLTVKENLLHFGQMYNLKKHVLIDNSKNLLKFTGLLAYRNHLAEELSGGMQKRLDIACSLVHKPKVLFLDEPVLNLDPALKRDILHLIQEVNKQGVTVVIASHDLETIEQLCSKVAILHNKRVLRAGILEDVKQPYYPNSSTITLRTGKHHVALLRFVSDLGVGVIDNTNHLVIQTDQLTHTVTNVASFIEREGLALTHLELSTPTLKSIFEHITTNSDT